MITMTGLPREIAGLVSEHLTTDDFRNLRQACSTMNANAFHAFAKRYYHTRCLMLGKDSLLNLVDISKTDNLAPLVQEVVITSDQLSEVHYMMCQWSSENNALDHQAYREHLSQQHDILNDYESGVKVLSDAFMCLPNLRKVSFSDRLHPWGADRLCKKIGVNPTRGDFSIFLESAWRLFLQVACKTSIQEIEMSFYENVFFHPKTASPSSLVLSSDLIQQELGHLRTLRLVVGFTGGIQWQPSDFVQMFRPFPQLSHLGLDFAWSAMDNDLEKLSEVLCIPHLQVLELSALSISAQSLTPFLLRHRKTLQRVVLSQVRIVATENWSRLLMTLQEKLPSCSLVFTCCSLWNESLDLGVELPMTATAEELTAAGMPVQACNGLLRYVQGGLGGQKKPALRSNPSCFE